MNELFSFISGENIERSGLTILYLVLSFLALFIARYFKNKADINKSSYKSGDVSYILALIEDIVEKAVKATNQTFVDDCKESGEFDEDAQNVAFSMTMEQIESIIAPQLRVKVEDIIGDFNEYVQTLIENKVAANKTLTLLSDCFEEDEDDEDYTIPENTYDFEFEIPQGFEGEVKETDIKIDVDALPIEKEEEKNEK